MTTIFVVEAEHPYVPGRVQSLHRTVQGAERKAAELVSTIINKPATQENWRTLFAAFCEEGDYDDSQTYVEITERELEN